MAPSGQQHQFSAREGRPGARPVSGRVPGRRGCARFRPFGRGRSELVKTTQIGHLSSSDLGAGLARMPISPVVHMVEAGGCALPTGCSVCRASTSPAAPRPMALGPSLLWNRMPVPPTVSAAPWRYCHPPVAPATRLPEPARAAARPYREPRARGAPWDLLEAPARVAFDGRSGIEL